ncbi:MAG: hypothetical protein QOE54_3699 [Streptosporangiaceae bacterium]|jgi:hypothetical protein|nr:hypothetical protein [Streptosporangiaceae bacterium]
MSEHDTDVLDALRGSLQDVTTMRTPVEEIIAVGRTRRRRRRLIGAASAVAATAGLAAAVSSPFGGGSANEPGFSTAAGTVHVRTVAFTVDTRKDGTVLVTWDKERYFKDRTGLQAALTKAGFPVLIKVGEFCKGPQDNGTLDPSGVGPGVDRVMKGHKADGGKVAFTFTPSAMPAGTQLFIGYLSPSQLQVTHGRPGSVERLVPTAETLTCTTQAPPPNTTQRTAPVPKG